MDIIRSNFIFFFLVQSEAHEVHHHGGSKLTYTPRLMDIVHHHQGTKLAYTSSLTIRIKQLAFIGHVELYRLDPKRGTSI